MMLTRSFEKNISKLKDRFLTEAVWRNRGITSFMIVMVFNCSVRMGINDVKIHWTCIVNCFSLIINGLLKDN